VTIATEKSGDTLTVKLDGRLDATTAPQLDAKLDLDGVRELVLDFGACHYISSAGIRSILKAHQAMAKAQGKMVVTNVSPHVREVFDLTGLSDMITIGKKTREISIEGLELLSAGVCGECYRLDHETVVKVYNEGVGPEIAEREKQYSKAAFVMGVPTAISYDVVSCGKRSGVVYELLDAELFSAVIRKDLGNLDRYAKMLSDTAKTLHAATGDKNVLPDLKDRFRGDLRPVLNDVQKARAFQICQHGDVVMASSKALFINPKMWNRRCLTPLQAPLDSSVHDRLQGILTCPPVRYQFLS